MSPLVIALAGTDHHPFERMVDWMDAAATSRPDLRFLVQHGATRAPRVAEGVDYLTHASLLTALAEATVVVCHGGPGTITDAREAGHVPLCIPRDPELGEHVDGHQQRFATMVDGGGVVRLVTSREEFERELAAALTRRPSSAATELSTRNRDLARAKLADELNGLMAAPRRRSLFSRAS